MYQMVAHKLHACWFIPTFCASTLEQDVKQLASTHNTSEKALCDLANKIETL